MMLRLVLELSTDFNCYEADNGTDALDVWLLHRPHVVVLDQAMPGMTGLDVASGILEIDSDQIVILYGAYIDEKVLSSAEALGIHAVLSKSQFTALAKQLTDANDAAR